MKISKYLFGLFICLSSCKGQNVCDCRLIEESIFSVPNEEVLLLNKQIIPCLIDSIDTHRISFIGFKSPMSSYIDTWQINQIGIQYAYLVDYILSKDSVETVKKYWSDDDILHWAELLEPYRIYDIGIIVKQDKNNKPILEPLVYEDMVNIRKMYSEWWKKNKDKPIETLREEFRKGNKILQLPYVWI